MFRNGFSNNSWTTESRLAGQYFRAVVIELKVFFLLNDYKVNVENFVENMQ